MIGKNNTEIAITGIGMITPVGRTALQTCASIRADISRSADIEYFQYENDWFETIPLKGSLISGVTDGYLGLGRFTKMASMAIEDLLLNSKLPEADLSMAGFYSGLPSPERKGVDTRAEDYLCKRVEQWLNISFGNIRKTYPEGHAATAKAVKEAIADLTTDKIRYAIVGGVDSLVEPDTLNHLMKTERLITEENPDGFFPGEAAAYFLLETIENAEKRSAEILAVIEAPSFEIEPETIDSDSPSTCKGLRHAIRGTFDQLDDNGTNTGLIICDLNGETYRSKEFGTIIPGVFNHITSPWIVDHPAENTGDTGAASFALSVCAGARAIQRGYAKTENILIWGASDEGLRGSVYIRKYTTPEEL